MSISWRWLAVLTAAGLAAASVGLASPAGAVAGYGDVSEGTWYTGAVQWSVDNGIAGVAGACFAPDIPVSRGETAVWIYNMENQPSAGVRHPFTDVTDASQDDAVSWMANNEITTGKSPTTFAPDDTLTRAEAATFLHRLAGKPSAPPHSFVDVVAGWQQGGVSWMADTGITTGTSPTTFAPEVTLTRAHLVTFLYRYQGEPDVTINTATPVCDPADDAETVAQYQTGDTIAGFPSGFAAVSGNFSGASVVITGGGSTVTVEITRNGSASYSDTTYTCASVGGCAIVNGRVTKGTVKATIIGADGEADAPNLDGQTDAPDLVVGTPTVTNDNPPAGTRFTLNAIVRNQGDSRSRSTTLRYYQSTDATITTTDTRIDSDWVWLDAGESEAESARVTAPSVPGTYYYGACVEPVSDESDTTNNCSPAVAVTVGEAPAPDLVVDTPTVTNDNPPAGTRFTLNAIVRNQGDSRSRSTTLRYYQSTDATITTTDTRIDSDWVWLDAGESEAESARVTAPSVPGTYYYGACVEPVSDESDTTNNCSPAVAVTVGEAPAPDLVVDTPTVTNDNPPAGTRFTLNANVRNQGNSRSTSTTLRYYQSTDATITTTDTQIDTDRVSWLDAQEREAESTSVTAPSTPRTYYYGTCVDTVSDESDTTNNCSTAVTVTVGDAPAPDLVVDTPTVDTSAPGGRFTLSATVRNQGDAPSVSTTLRYYRSVDATITTGDTEVGTDSVSGSWLHLTGLDAEEVSLFAPSSPGVYYYGACVDSVSDESDTTNNCSASVAVTVVAAPAPDLDLVVDTPTVSTNRPAAGERLTLSASVRNQGSDRTSASTTLRFYRSTDPAITTTDDPEGFNFWVRWLNQESRAQSIYPLAPSTPGTFYYGACVEPVYGESDTTNNCSPAVTVTVGTAPPDLVVGSPTVDTSSPVVHGHFIFGAVVRNLGDGRSASTMLRYFQSTDATITTGDMEVGFVGDSVSGLDAQETRTESIILNAPWVPGTYYYGACVDSVSYESDTTNNCSSAVAVTVRAAPAPDLVVDTPTVSTRSPAAGERFTLSASVRNQGDAPSVSTNLRYYRSVDATITTGDTVVSTDSVSGSLLRPAGLSAEEASLFAPSSPGVYYYGACVDSVRLESDTTNNCSAPVAVTVGAAPVPAPDLVVDSPTVDTSSPFAGRSFTLSAVVRNLGDGWSASTTLRYYQSTDATITTGDTEVGTDPVYLLEPQWIDADRIILTAPSAPGTYYYGACVDSLSDESNTTNNCSPALTIVVGEPDLVVDNPLEDLGSVDGGPTYRYVVVVVRNQGTGSSPYTSLQYYLSTDSTITSEDTSLGGDYSGSPVGSSDSLRVSLFHLGQVPSTAGTYYYGVCVDSVPGEINTTNNCSAVVKATVEPADLTPVVPTLITFRHRPSDEFELRVSVLNRGNLSSVPTTLRYYRSTDATITRSDTLIGTDSVGNLSPHRSSLQGIVLTEPSAAGTYYYGACVDAIENESTTNNCSEAVQVTVGAVQPPALTLRLTECFVFQDQHFVSFRVTAHENVSSLVVKTYQVEGRNNTKHLMATTNVGNLAAGNSYTKLTSRLFPANLRRNLTTCTADVAWSNGTHTPDSNRATTAIPDLPPPDPTDTPVPPAERPPTFSQVVHLWVSLDRVLYQPYTDCGYSGTPPCPTVDHIAWWSQLPAHLRQLATRP